MVNKFDCCPGGRQPRLFRIVFALNSFVTKQSRPLYLGLTVYNTYRDDLSLGMYNCRLLTAVAVINCIYCFTGRCRCCDIDTCDTSSSRQRVATLKSIHPEIHTVSQNSSHLTERCDVSTVFVVVRGMDEDRNSDKWQI